VEKRNPIDRRSTSELVLSSPQSPKPANHLQDIAEQAARAIEYLTSQFGPFPFPSLSITQMPGTNSQGFPGLIYLSSYAFLSDNERSTKRGFNPDINNILYDRVMTTHEVSHQWWGDSVTWKSYRDEWLMEAISQYFALMMLEKEHPADFQSVMEYYRNDLLRVVHDSPIHEAGPVTLGVRLFSSKYPASYDDIIYGRGAWLIHMLRMLLRSNPQTSAVRADGGGNPDELFLRVMKKLHEHHRGGTLSMHEFQSAFETALPRSLRYEDTTSLDWFFQSWVEGTSIPSITLKDVKFEMIVATAKSPAHRSATAQLVQEFAPEQMVSSVPVYAVNMAGAFVYAGRFFADGPETEITMSVPADTKRLVVDPFHTLLTRH
jgi:aminopeptidase N